jgi:transcription termination factor Rho
MVAANGCLFDYSHHLSLITVLVCLQFISHCITQGASKAKLKEDDLTREEIIESIATDVKKNLKEVDGVVDAEMKEAIEHIKQLANNASDNPDAIYVLMSRFTRQNLVKFNSVNGTTDVNNLQKYQDLEKRYCSRTLSSNSGKRMQTLS